MKTNFFFATDLLIALFRYFVFDVLPIGAII